VYGEFVISPSISIDADYGNPTKGHSILSAALNLIEYIVMRVSQMRSQGMLYFHHSNFLTHYNVSAPVWIAKDCFDCIMTPDFNKYRQYIDGFNLTETQKRELVQTTVWSTMESFVDKAWGMHPVQQCTDRAERGLQDSRRILESKNSSEGPES